MIVVDASVLIAHLDDHDVHHARADAALLAAADQPFACSPLAADAPVRLAALRADTGLKLPDCCVLLAADAASADGVLTFDDALAREGERPGVRVGSRSAAIRSSLTRLKDTLRRAALAVFALGLSLLVLATPASGASKNVQLLTTLSEAKDATAINFCSTRGRAAGTT